MRHDAVMAHDDPGVAGTGTPRTLPSAVAVLLWLAAAVVAGGVVWWAVSAVGAGTATAGAVLTQDEVAAALADATSAPAPATPTGTPTVEPTTPPAIPTATAPPTTAPAAPVARVWDVTGGQVAVQCVGSAVALLYATPADGWTVQVEEAGPLEVEVELERGDDDVKVRATCVDGVPTQHPGSGDGAGDGSGDGSGGSGSGSDDD